MGFKRNGGDIANKNLGGSERFSVTAITIGFVGGLIAYGTGQFVILILSVVISLCLLFIGNRNNIPIKNKYTVARIATLIKHVKTEYEARNYEKALEYIATLKRYTSLNDEVERIEKRCRNAVQIKSNKNHKDIK